MPMTPDFHAQIEARLLALRQFLATCPPKLRGARVFRYCGADLLDALDVPPAQMEAQVSASMSEGLRVDWLCRNELVYLRVFEGAGPVPSWERVFAQQDLEEVRAMLQEADAGGDAWCAGGTQPDLLD